MAKLAFAHVHNRTSPSNRVWLGGCRKKQLIDIGIPKKEIISEHDWGNWIFSVPRKYLPMCVPGSEYMNPDWSVIQEYMRLYGVA